MEQNRDNVPTQQTTSDKNLRRRTAYAQMSQERKQSFLSHLRAKRAELKKNKNSQQSNSIVALTITPSSLAPQQGIAENRDNVPTPEKTSARNLSRRTRYAQMSPKRKELLLSQLRDKRDESKRQNLLHQSNTTATLTGTSTTAQHTVNCSSTFELGSTSATCHAVGKLPLAHIANKVAIAS